METLARFAAAGVRQAVLSATRRDMLESQIARFPIRAYFTDVLGLSDIYARSKEAVAWTTWPAAACPPRPPS